MQRIKMNSMEVSDKTEVSLCDIGFNALNAESMEERHDKIETKGERCKNIVNSDFKIHYGEALVRQKCEILLPVTSLLMVRGRFPAVARLSDAANMTSWRSVHYVSKLL